MRTNYTITQKGVKDLPQQIKFDTETFTIIMKCGRKIVHKYTISVDEYMRHIRFYNPNYSLRKLVELKFYDSEPLVDKENICILDRILDEHCTGIKTLYKMFENEYYMLKRENGNWKWKYNRK